MANDQQARCAPCRKGLHLASPTVRGQQWGLGKTVLKLDPWRDLLSQPHPPSRNLHGPASTPRPLGVKLFGVTGSRPHRRGSGRLRRFIKTNTYMLITILLIILILALIGSVPAYPYSRDWGYAPSGGLGTLLLILLILWLLGII